MISTVLLAHISIAVLSLTMALGVVGYSSKQNVAKAESWVKKMWLSTGWAVFSGFWLSFIASAPITQACTSALILVSAISLAHLYKKFVLVTEPGLS